MDFRLFRAVNRLADHTGWAHSLLADYAKYGIVLFPVLMLLAYFEARRGPVAVLRVARTIWSGVAALIAFGVNQVIGNAVDRARPYATHPGVHVLVSRTHDFSFPSDHTTVTAAIGVALLLASRRIGAVAAVLAVLMAFVRVYVGAHYPGDVLAGLVVGGVVGGAGWFIARPLLVPVVQAVTRRVPVLVAR